MRAKSGNEPMQPFRIIQDQPASGLWNMAVDEMLLERVAITDRPTLRFYAWSEPTLSLGYFQKLDERELHTASHDCPVVRRSTGGGAIVHDREITYSVALPLANRWSAQATDLYQLFHGTLLRALANLQVNAHLCQTTVRQLAEPFLCFERRA